MATRREILETARRLEAQGDLAGAARAYQAAGELEKLEEVLTRESDLERDARTKKDSYARVSMHLASGERREALAILETRAAGGDTGARARKVELTARRACGAFACVVVRDRAFTLAIGSEVVIGRTEGIAVPAHAMSRRHVRIARRADGAIVVSDLGSRNGTLLRGARITGEIMVAEGIELALGGEVPMRVAPSGEIAGAVSIDVGGSRYAAPLGAARIGVGDWTLEIAHDGWIELVTGDAPPAFDRELRLAARVPLLVGDAFSSDRDGPVVLRIEAP